MRDDLDRIIRHVVAPAARRVDMEGVFPIASLRELGKAGFYSLMVPTAHGGRGAAALDFLQVCRTISAACASSAMAYVMHVTSVNALVIQADDEQRERFLRPVVEGRWLVTEAISEPGSGSQWWSLASTSRRLPDGRFAVQAMKSFATSAGHADLYMVSTRSPDSDDHLSNALFAIEGSTAGIVSGPWDALGLRGSSSGGMTFDVTVDAQSMIFGDGDADGLRLYNESNQPLYHLGIGSVYLGIVDAILEASVARVKGRSYAQNASGYGTQLSGFPVTRRHIGEMEMARFSLEAACEKIARDMDAAVSFDGMAIGMTALKVLAAQTAADVGRQSLLACGGASYSRRATTLERHMRDALAGSLMGPNDDFCKELIGRLKLGSGDYHALGQ